LNKKVKVNQLIQMKQKKEDLKIEEFNLKLKEQNQL